MNQILAMLHPGVLMPGLLIGAAAALIHFRLLHLMVQRLIAGAAPLWLIPLHLGRFVFLALVLGLSLKTSPALLPGLAIGLLAGRWLAMRWAERKS